MAGRSRFGLAAAAQPDGQVVIAGEQYGDPQGSFGVTRVGANGTVDSSFGNAGFASIHFDPGSAAKTSEIASSVAIQPDGKIVVGGGVSQPGNRQAALARLDPSGNLDPSFGSGGKVLQRFHADDTLSSIGLEPDGKIVAAGTAFPGGTGKTTDFLIARFNANGAADGSFGVGGAANVGDFGGSDSGRGVGIQPGGAIVAAGLSNASGAKQMTITRVFGDPAVSSIALSSRIRCVQARQVHDLRAGDRRGRHGDAAGQVIAHPAEVAPKRPARQAQARTVHPCRCTTPSSQDRLFRPPQ